MQWLIACEVYSLWHILEQFVILMQLRRVSIRWECFDGGCVVRGGAIRLFLDAIDALLGVAVGLTFVRFGTTGAGSAGFAWSFIGLGLAVTVYSALSLGGLVVWRGIDPRIELDPDDIRIIPTDGRPWTSHWTDHPYANESLRSNRIALTDDTHPYQRISMNGIPVTHLYLQHLLDHFRAHPEDITALNTPEGLTILHRITT